MTEYLSIKDVSEMTGVNRTTILYRLRADNKAFPEPDCIIRHGRINTYGWLPKTINNYIELNKKEN
jgi:predicted DNA-binding transcriptional regulator AlpA|nr:MAG TPA: Pyocin activator protein PrtN [Caudoviricetes sp.]